MMDPTEILQALWKAGVIASWDRFPYGGGDAYWVVGQGEDTPQIILTQGESFVPLGQEVAE